MPPNLPVPPSGSTHRPQPREPKDPQTWEKVLGERTPDPLGGGFRGAGREGGCLGEVTPRQGGEYRGKCCGTQRHGRRRDREKRGEIGENRKKREEQQEKGGRTTGRRNGEGKGGAKRGKRARAEKERGSGAAPEVEPRAEGGR